MRLHCTCAAAADCHPYLRNTSTQMPSRALTPATPLLIRNCNAWMNRGSAAPIKLHMPASQHYTMRGLKGGLLDWCRYYAHARYRRQYGIRARSLSLVSGATTGLPRQPEGLEPGRASPCDGRGWSGVGASWAAATGARCPGAFSHLVCGSPGGQVDGFEGEADTRDARAGEACGKGGQVTRAQVA